MEVMVGIAVLLVVSLTVYGVLYRSTTVSTQMSSLMDRQEQGRIVLDRIADEIRHAKSDTVIVGGSNGSSSISFQKYEDVGGVPTLSAVITVRISDATEGRLVREEGTDTIGLCRGVPTGGFAVSLSGNVYTLTLRLRNTSLTSEQEGSAQVATVTTKVSPRN
jgi:hypothetical protein